MLRSHHHALQSIYEKRLCVGECWNVVTGVTSADKAGHARSCGWYVVSWAGFVVLVFCRLSAVSAGWGGLGWWHAGVSGTRVWLGWYHPHLPRQQRWANRIQGRRNPPRTLHTNHTNGHDPPYLLRWLQSPHFSTLLHTVFSHIYFVKHDDEISTSATHIIISVLESTF